MQYCAGRSWTGTEEELMRFRACSRAKHSLYKQNLDLTRPTGRKLPGFAKHRAQANTPALSAFPPSGRFQQGGPHVEIYGGQLTRRTGAINSYILSSFKFFIKLDRLQLLNSTERHDNSHDNDRDIPNYLIVLF